MNLRQRRAAEALSEIRELVAEYGAARVAVLLDVHPDTVARWLAGTTRPPTAVLVALRAAAHGVMPGMQVQHWKGWRFAPDGMLYGPHSARGYWPAHIAAMHYEQQLLASLRAENRALHARVEALLDANNTAANDAVMLRQRSP